MNLPTENCGGCVWLVEIRDERYRDMLPRPGKPWPTYKVGSCRRFPQWQEKRPETPWCGEYKPRVVED